MNYNNLSQKTNYLCGSDELNFGPVYLQSFSLPGMSFSHPELGGSRYGAKLHVQSDSVSYNQLTFTILIDEHFKSYFEFYNKVLNGFNPESGNFANQEFTFWVTLTDSKGYPVFKVDFYSCRISDLGDIEIASNDDTVYNTLSVTCTYDYYKVDNTADKLEKFLKEMKEVNY